MFMSQGLSCHCVLFDFCVYPFFFRNGAGCWLLFCLGESYVLFCQVCAFMETFTLLIVVLCLMRGLAGIIYGNCDW